MPRHSRSIFLSLYLSTLGCGGRQTSVGTPPLRDMPRHSRSSRSRRLRPLQCQCRPGGGGTAPLARPHQHSGGRVNTANRRNMRLALFCILIWRISYCFACGFRVYITQNNIQNNSARCILVILCRLQYAKYANKISTNMQNYMRYYAYYYVK